jgi:hypothetical protein
MPVVLGKEVTAQGLTPSIAGLASLAATAARTYDQKFALYRLHTGLSGYGARMTNPTSDDPDDTEDDQLDAPDPA